MPLWWLWLMAAAFLMVWLLGKFQNGFVCPFCGARSEEDHEPGCHGAGRW